MLSGKDGDRFCFPELLGLGVSFSFDFEGGFQGIVLAFGDLDAGRSERSRVQLGEHHREQAGAGFGGVEFLQRQAAVARGIVVAHGAVGLDQRILFGDGQRVGGEGQGAQGEEERNAHGSSLAEANVEARQREAGEVGGPGFAGGDGLGGTCLNVGCIPSKALLASSEEFENVNHHLADHGITVEGAKVDVAAPPRDLQRRDGIGHDLVGLAGHRDRRRDADEDQQRRREKAAADAAVTEKLRAAGGVFFGKTTTPEFGWKGMTDSPLSGITRNPWNPDRTPGGSSGGAAAALAAGITTLEYGSDIGGSIRGPWASMPPLLTMESMLFRLIALGFALLTLTLASGAIYSETLFGQAMKFNHKTLFAIISWLIFAALLCGRYLYGWRGRQALRWTLSGFASLLGGKLYVNTSTREQTKQMYA